MPGIILPRKTVHELQRLLDDSETKVEVSVSRAKARFQIGGITVTTKLVDGTFPDYQRVIPKGNDKVLKLASGDFMAAIDRVSTIQSERGRAIKLSLGSPDKLALSVNNPEGGQADEELAADYGPASSSTNAGPMEIGFNSTYLLGIAKQIEAESTEILLADPGSPVVVKDESDVGLLYVLMPMRV